MGRNLVKDIPLYICGGDGKETDVNMRFMDLRNQYKARL